MSSGRSQPGLLGIDLGTSSVKVVVLGLQGSLLAQAGAAYPVHNVQPAWAESEPSDWWSAIQVAVREAVTKAGADPVSIGLSGQMHGLVPTASDGVPVRNAILWADSRAVEQIDAYRALSQSARARLANPLSPGMAGPILVWLKVHELDVYRAMRWALQPKDWVRARLTGEFFSEPSDASATLLYDVAGGCWDTAVIDALGLDPTKLPSILATSGQCAGQLLPDVARELGLRPGIPVAAGAGDTAAAALGSGLVHHDTAQLTLGTGAQIVTPADAPALTAWGDGVGPATHFYRGATDHGFYAMAAILNGGLALGWVRQLLGASWAELYAAADLPLDPDSPIFLPHLNGERTPYLDPAMRGAWIGLSPRHSRSDLMRAALEGVAFAVREGLDALFPGSTSVAHLWLAGGGSTAPGWRQMLADVLNHELLAVDVAAASGRGAAFLGARAAGLFNEPEMLNLLSPTTGRAATPASSNTAHYAERHARFHAAVDRLRTLEPKEPKALAS